jgi:thiol:disulfide interchange protein
VRQTPTAPIAAASLIGGYAVAVGSGSRPLGGVVMLAGGLWCVREWSRRTDPRTAFALACTGLAAFVLSHVLARAIGAWPAVLLVSAATALAAWLLADSRTSAVHA